MAKLANKTNDKKNKTEKKANSDPIKSLTWSIRDVGLETRAIIIKAAKLHGKTISQYITDDVRAFAQGQIVKTNLPATSKDMDNQISLAKIMEKLEGIESRLPETESKSFWGRLFH